MFGDGKGCCLFDRIRERCTISIFINLVKCVDISRTGTVIEWRVVMETNAVFVNISRLSGRSLVNDICIYALLCTRINIMLITPEIRLRPNTRCPAEFSDLAYLSTSHYSHSHIHSRTRSHIYIYTVTLYTQSHIYTHSTILLYTCCKCVC